MAERKLVLECLRSNSYVGIQSKHVSVAHNTHTPVKDKRNTIEMLTFVRFLMATII